MPDDASAESSSASEFTLLPANATRDEILLAFAVLSRSYATATAQLAQQLPALTAAIADLRAELVVVAVHARRSDAAATSLLGRVNVLLGRVDKLTEPPHPESSGPHAMPVTRTEPMADDPRAMPPRETLEELFSKVEKSTRREGRPPGYARCSRCGGTTTPTDGDSMRCTTCGAVQDPTE